MNNYIVVDNPRSWPLHVPSVPVISGRAYLTDPYYSNLRNVKIFNLCRSYRYQSTGYYVSLLATARRHKTLPSIATIQDLRTFAIARIVADDVEDLIRRSLKPIISPTFSLSVYFGQNMARRYADLSQRLFRLFPAPLLRAEFERADGQWRLRGIRLIAASEIPENHHVFVVQAAQEFFVRNRLPQRMSSNSQYDLAILSDPKEPNPPSNRGALTHFAASAKRHGLSVEFISRDDFGRLAEFDALFIRETTYVNHHTYRFSRRAAAEGLVVIDDPESIAKCTNKVFLAESLARSKVPSPRSMIVHRDNRDRVAPTLGLPCILKQPDSAFSQGVIKVDDESALREQVDRLLDQSDLIVAQEFLPTEFDWRIGVLDRQPLYACQYFMVKEHWQIAKTDSARTRYGDVKAVPLDEVPPAVLRAAVRSANLIGDGLYGVDVKQIKSKVYVIEINDNPSLDSGCEDAVLHRELYDRIMASFAHRIAQNRNGQETRHS